MSKQALRTALSVETALWSALGGQVTICPKRTAYGGESKQRRNERTFQGR